VEVTIRQLAKCKWNLELASNFFNLLTSLASVFFLLSVSLFSPLIESYSSPIPKYKRTPDTVIYLLLWHTHSHYGLFSSRTSTDKVHTVQMLSNDMILASFSLIW
jgi:hypothetical protein